MHRDMNNMRCGIGTMHILGMKIVLITGNNRTRVAQYSCKLVTSELINTCSTLHQ